MLPYSKLPSAAKLAIIALSVAGIAAALGLPLSVAAQRTIPEPHPVVGMTQLDMPEDDTPEDAPEDPAPPPDQPEPPEESAPEAGESANMTPDEIRAAVQALLDGESAASGTVAPPPEDGAPSGTVAPPPEDAGQTAEQAAAEQAAAEQAAVLAQQQAEEQAAREAEQQAQEQARREAEQASSGAAFHFNPGDYSHDKGGYFDKLDGSRAIVASEFPTGNYTGAEQITYEWTDGESYPATLYTAESGMVVIEVFFF